MKKFTKHILLLALMLFGALGASAKVFTSLQEGDVIHVGDQINPGSFSRIDFGGQYYGVSATATWTLVRANLGPYYGPEGVVTVTESETGDYYVFKFNNAYYFTDETRISTTENSDGLVVTSVSIKYSSPYIVFAVHEFDPYAPALDELTGHWNFLMPGSNKVVKAVLYDSIVLGPHVSVASQPTPAFISYTRSDSTVLYYDPTLDNSSFAFEAADNDGNGRNFAFWADEQDNHNTVRLFGALTELTCGQRIVAVYPELRTLTLSPSAGGTLTLDGVTTRDSVLYIIEIDEEEQNITAYPYQKVFYYGEDVDRVNGGNADVSIAKTGDHQVTVTVHRGFNGSVQLEVELSENNEPVPGWVFGVAGTPNGSVTIVETPYGIKKTGNNTYSVMEGLTVNVTATPDSAHYLAHIGSTDTVGNYACGYSFQMPSNNYNLEATFEAKPTLTLAQSDGGTIEAIVPQGGAIVKRLTADMVPDWQNNYAESFTEALLQEKGFVAVDSAVAAAWTGAPESGYAYLIYKFDGDECYYLTFGNGDNYGPTNDSYAKGVIYSWTTSPIPLCFTTGASTANVVRTADTNTYIIDYGTDVTVTAEPDEYYHLDRWTNQAGTEVASVTPLTVTVTSDTTLMAVFERNMRILHGVPEGWTVMADSVSVAVSADSAVVPAGSQIMMIPPVPVKPTVKSTEVEKYLHPNEVPLTMEALTAGNIEVNMSGTLTTGMKYSVNGGAKNLITTTTTIDVAAGDKVQFYGNGNSTQAYGYDPFVKILGTAQTKVYGNIMSLLDEDNFATLTALPTQESVFYGLFQNNANLTDASGLLLPATTLADYCYTAMFKGCSSLTAAPALPATTLAEACYRQMFYGCSSLTAAPALPATTLATGCYYVMFYNCTSLTTAPELPATTLAEACYRQMFYNCTTLVAAPALPATTLADYCYYNMFKNCSNLASVTCLATDISAEDCTGDWLDAVAETGIFITPASTNWPSGVSGIPEGWNRTTTINFATASDCGKIVCSAGHLHDAGSQLPEGCTLVGIMAKVNADGHGLILGNLEGRLEDAYGTIDLFYQTVNYGGTTLKRLPGYMLANLPNCATLGNIPTSNWCVASMDDYKAMFVNLGSQSAEQSYDNNVNATITAAGGIAITDGSEYQEWGFWCTSKHDDLHGWFFKKNSWSYADWEENNTIYSRYLLPVLAF